MVEWKVGRDESGTLFVWVHGSNDLKDWVYNLLTGKRWIDRHSRVSRWDRYEAIKVLRAIRADVWDVRTMQIKIGGHSRGGAIAQIIAYELAQDEYVSLEVFGTKRAGNWPFVGWLEENLEKYKCVAWRNRGDWVTYLPPWYAYLKQTIMVGEYRAKIGQAHRYDTRRFWETW